MKRPQLDDCKVRPFYLVLNDYEAYVRYLEKIIQESAEMVSYLQKRLERKE